jgi:Protein of unknown function (DUF1264)
MCKMSSLNCVVMALAAGTVLVGCGGSNTDSKVSAPGSQESATTKALETGADMLQGKAPLGALNAYLDGFHFYSGNLQGQMEAHHYCGHLNEDSIQCVIFDGNAADAKLMGVEYIVSKRLFETLPTEEKHLWHSHVHEVRSGTLIAPGIPDVAEHALMQQLAETYGKTWHTWHTDRRDALPLGTPMLMMGFTQDGQLDEQLLKDRDRRFEVSSQRKREQRADIDYPPVDAEADAWQKGIVPQLELSTRK